MRCCEACFERHANPLQAFPTETASLGNCELCQRKGADVWGATSLLDAFSGVLAHYDADNSPNAKPVADALQHDWSIFAAESLPRVPDFLAAVFRDTDVNTVEPVVLRRATGAPQDQADAWQAFADDLMFGNRFFPSSRVNQDHLRDIIETRVKTVDPGMEFYRARVCDTATGFLAAQMSMPPANKATAGRANPLGIPHLYLAKDLETCIRESRAVQHNFVTVAVFEVRETVRVLDLDGFTPPNPFAIETGAAERLDAAQTIHRLGRELQRPVRPTDNQVEYVPTQYLSGLVMSMGLDGILYSSSLQPGGTNAVLFADGKVAIRGTPETYEIVSMTLTRKAVHSPMGGD